VKGLQEYGNTLTIESVFKVCCRGTNYVVQCISFYTPNFIGGYAQENLAEFGLFILSQPFHWGLYELEIHT
jgi:hypothetical protein